LNIEETFNRDTPELCAPFLGFWNITKLGRNLLIPLEFGISLDLYGVHRFQIAQGFNVRQMLLQKKNVSNNSRRAHTFFFNEVRLYV
jgi:hypothetical protein